MLNVEIKTVEPQTVAFIPMRGAYSQIPEAMGRLYGWIAMHGLRAAGMPSGVYLTDPATAPEADAAWEIRAPLDAALPEAAPDEAGVGVKHVTSCLVASAMHRGPYEGVARTYEELTTWTSANGYDIAGPPEELYYSDPSTPPQDTLTEIRFPVTKR